MTASHSLGGPDPIGICDRSGLYGYRGCSVHRVGGGRGVCGGVWECVEVGVGGWGGGGVWGAVAGYSGGVS